MLPSSIAVSVMLLALVPGWFHLRLRERLAPASTATGLSELLEVLAIGMATTGVSGAVLIFVPHRWLPLLLDVDSWAREGTIYLRSHIRDATLSAVAVLTLALVIAYLLYLPLRLTRPAEFRAQGSVWVHALGARPKGRVPWVGLQLKDGKLVEGLLHSCSLSEGPLEERDVALGRPIRVTLAQGQSARCLDLDRLVVPGNEISYIAILHVRER